MIPAAFLILFAAFLWRLLPELRHVDAIETAFQTPKGAEASTLAGLRSASLGAGDALSHGRTVLPPVSSAPFSGDESA